jgi:hypothetical protein
VAGGSRIYTTGNLAIYNNAQSTPTVYQTNFFSLAYCTYDGSGNAFADANVNGSSGSIVELPEGANQLANISLNQNLGPGGPIQWDGQYLAVGSPKVSGHPYSGPNTVYRVAISGSSGMVVKTVELSGGSGAKRDKNAGAAQFWVQGQDAVAPRSVNGPVAIWKYPKGGKPVATFTVKPKPIYGLTLSVPSSHSMRAAAWSCLQIDARGAVFGFIQLCRVTAPHR